MQIIDNYSMVNYQQLNITEEDSMQDLMTQIDNLVQFDEHRMPKDSHFLDN